MLCNPNATVFAKKYYCGGKASIGLNDRKKEEKGGF